MSDDALREARRTLLSLLVGRVWRLGQPGAPRNIVISPPAARGTWEDVAGGRAGLAKQQVGLMKKRGSMKKAHAERGLATPAWHADVARLVAANPQWRSKRAIEIARNVLQHWGREDTAVARRAEEAGVPYEPPPRPRLTAVRTAIPDILKEI